MFYNELIKIKEIEVFKKPVTGITLFRPTNMKTEEFLAKLPKEMFSKCINNNKEYIRSVALNPLADVDKIIELIKEHLKE